MTQDLKLRCDCGQFQGVLHDAGPHRGRRIRCYCRDCQAYAHHLDRATAVLDEHGGTGLFQTTPRGLEITTGEDHLACLRFSPKGPLRWYTDCCGTPIANTMADAKLPFVTLVSSIWERADDALLGPKELGIFARHAHGTPTGLEAADGIPAMLLLRVGLGLIGARLRGEHRNSPFFDSVSAHPRVIPKILSREERAAAQDRCG